MLRHVRCISFDSNIKPQQWVKTALKDNVVYLLIPTSNHNFSELLSEPNTSFSELSLPPYMNAISAKKTIWLSVISKDISNTHYI